MGSVYEALKRNAEKDVQAKEDAATKKPVPTKQAANGNHNARGKSPNVKTDSSAARVRVPAANGAAVASNGNGAKPLSGGAAASTLPESGELEELFQESKIFTPNVHVSDTTTKTSAHDSASNEHTTGLDGSALSVNEHGRAAGATLDAVSSTRVAQFPSMEVAAARVEPHLVAIRDPRSAHAELYRSLRTRVLHAAERRNMQAFVITSANVGEGKTMTSINLAWLLAQTDGVRALLIDGDLRRPCTTDYLDIDAPVGLSEVLTGEAKLEDAIVRLEPAGLHLLPGGAPRDNVAELLSGPKFSQVLSQVRRMFNYIIIDAPPLAIFTDATVLINRADAALLVVRAGHTRYATLDRVLEPLPQERILGVVLNSANEQIKESDYYYQRRRYNKHEAVPASDETVEVTDEVAAEN